MIEAIIAGALASAPPEFKSSLKKINEFMPMIKMYHDSMPLDKSKGELGVSYLLRFEATGIILYQVALASKPDVNNGKVFISRELNKWDVMAKVNELAGNS